MKLLFKQRVFSWLDSYDIFYEDGSVAYSVKSELSFGHHFNVHDNLGQVVGAVQQRVFAFFPRFDIYVNGVQMGTISREFSLFSPRYNFDFNGWRVEGDFMQWDYSIYGVNNEKIADISKELLHWSDTYVIDVCDPQNALYVLMFVLAIDAEKCSNN
ncbi:MAG: hypothetical protein MJ236_01295 [Clostridia bacterium]|nr:hypothetical protein [Clostridia bacterium]